MSDQPGPAPMDPDIRARYAEDLRRNPLLTQLIAEMTADCIETWKSGASPGQREDQWHRLNTIRAFEAGVQRAIDDALLAARAHRKRSAPA